MRLAPMTEEECFAFLKRGDMGHLAYISDEYPKLVPMHYAFESGRAYMFSYPGMKIAALRSNRHAAFQVEDITGDRQWTSVCLRGMYDELIDTPDLHNKRVHAWSLLQKRPLWWEPGSFAKADEKELPAPIFFCVSLVSVSGIKTVSSGGGDAYISD